MKLLIITLLTVTSTLHLFGQTSSKKIGGPCEGCEAIHESPVPFNQLPHSVALPDASEAGPKIEISGIVYERDGMTPARDVVLYVYHTDRTGLYPTKGNEQGWAKRHGYLRGWVKTDKNGYYQIKTLRPAAYPQRKNPEHIHITVKEPNRNEYYLDDFNFTDDPLLPKTKTLTPRGGNGIVDLSPADKNGVRHGMRQIILGLHVPDYPYAGLPALNSGLPVGATCPAFDPLHLSGADVGKKTCPMCRYGQGHGILLWFNHANLDQLARFAQTLEEKMKQKGESKLRVFLVYMNPCYKQNPDATSNEILRGKLKRWADEQNLKKVALTWIPSPVDEETAGVYALNPQAKNTVFVYHAREVTAKWVNIEYDNETTLRAILKDFE